MSFVRILTLVFVFPNVGRVIGEDAVTCSSESCMSENAPETSVSLMQTNMHIASHRKGTTPIEPTNKLQKGSTSVMFQKFEDASKVIKETRQKLLGKQNEGKAVKPIAVSDKTKPAHGAALVAKKADGKKADVCATYKRLYCAEGNTWTSTKTSKFATLQLCQASCTAVGKGYANYWPTGGCLCCDTGDYYANGFASLAGATDCTDPADTASQSTTTVAEVDSFVATWAATLGVAAYSVMAGDAGGVRYLTKQAASVPDPIHPAEQVDKAIVSFSVGKWAAAAALGRAVKEGVVSYDDTVNKYISFWSTASSDGRSEITFHHLMSHTSGLILDTVIQTALGMQEYVEHADLEYMNRTITLVDQVKLIYDETSSSITLPATYAYGESHYLVMQYAVMQAAGYSKWRDFFYDYWGAHLGLEKAKIIKYGAYTETDNYFWEGHDQSVAYGFYEENREGAADVLNPDSGSQLIISPCGYTRFLTEYTRQGTNWVGAGEMDDTQAQTYPDFVTYYFGNYGYGHWVYDDGIYNIWHSTGYAGATPIMSTTSSHDKFWIYLNIFDNVVGGMWITQTWIAEGVAIMRSLFEGPNLPAVTTEYCSTQEPTSYCVYDKKWEPVDYDSDGVAI